MTTRTRKPKIQYYWWFSPAAGEQRVNWRLIGANGETMCQSTQGFRDKADALRSVQGVLEFFVDVHHARLDFREVGPGRKPGTGAAK